MLEKNTTQLSHKDLIDEEIDFGSLVIEVIRFKLHVFVITFLFFLMSVVYVINLPDVYRSEALLAPVSTESTSRVSGQLGGLAALAGVNLAGASGDNVSLSIEIMKSREFITHVIQKYELAVPIYAAIGWERQTNHIIVDASLYDEESKIWTRKIAPPFLPEPSIIEVLDVFRTMYSVNHNKSTGLVSISVEHFSPYFAKEITDKLVLEINSRMRERELRSANKSIDYLNERVVQTQISEVRTMLFSLIEEQTKKVMLAKVKDDFIFETIDSALVSEYKVKPKRPLIVLLATLSGFLFSIFYVLIRKAKSQRRK